MYLAFGLNYVSFIDTIKNNFIVISKFSFLFWVLVFIEKGGDSQLGMWQEETTIS